jgi:hypothetical protein
VAAAACLTAPAAAQTAADYLRGTASPTTLHISAAHGGNTQGTPDATIFRTDATAAGFTAGRGAARTRSRDLAGINANFSSQITAAFHHDAAASAYLFLSDGWAVQRTNGQFAAPHKIDDRSWPGLQPYARSITAALNGGTVVWLFLNDGTYLQYDFNARTTAGPFSVASDWNGVGPSARNIRAALRWDDETAIFFLEDNTFLTYDLVSKRVFGGGAKPTAGNEWPGLLDGSVAANPPANTRPAPPTTTRPAPPPTTRPAPVPTTRPAPPPTTRPVAPQRPPAPNPPVNTRPARPATGIWVDTTKLDFSTTDDKILVNYGRLSGTGLIEIFRQGAIESYKTATVTAASGTYDFNGPFEAGPYYVKMTVGAVESPTWDFTVVTPPLRTRLRRYYTDNPVDVIYDRHDGKGNIQIWSVNPPGRIRSVSPVETDPAGGVVKFAALNQPAGKYEARLYTESTPGSGRFTLADASRVYPFELVARPVQPKADPHANASVTGTGMHHVLQNGQLSFPLKGRITGAQGATVRYDTYFYEWMPDSTWRLAAQGTENKVMTSTDLATITYMSPEQFGMPVSNRWHTMRARVIISIGQKRLADFYHDFQWYR